MQAQALRARAVSLLSRSTPPVRHLQESARLPSEDRRRQPSRIPQVRVRLRTGHRVEGLGSLRRHHPLGRTVSPQLASGVRGDHMGRCTILLDERSLVGPLALHGTPIRCELSATWRYRAEVRVPPSGRAGVAATCHVAVVPISRDDWRDHAQDQETPTSQMA